MREVYVDESYLKLVNFEVSRFFKLYLILIGLYCLSAVGAIIASVGSMKNAETMMYENQLSVNDYV